jgi:Zn-dependent alcohol dehydrogenase
MREGVSVRIEEDIITDSPVPTLQSTAVLSDGENSIKATAVVGVDLNQKGMQTAQQFGAASSYGKKYALGNLFLIDDTADADSTNSHGKASQLVNKVKPKMNDSQLDKAIEFVKGGGNIQMIESKYTISSVQMAELDVHLKERNG